MGTSRHWRVASWMVSIVCLAAAGARGQGLVDDPSFEQPKERDRFGRVFSAWEGHVYEPPARFEVSRIAHGGNTSCALVGDHRSKIRIFTPEKKLPAGRYRLRVWLRGVDVAAGPYNQPLDLVAFDGNYRVLKKSGSFGWTPVTHVFDVAPDAKPGRLSVGLLAGGRLWVDDVSLEAVDASVPLTNEPAWGEEESPLAPPYKITGQTGTIHCRDCGFRNKADAATCWLCGNAPTAAARERNVPPVKVIADFESGLAPFTGNGKHVTEEALSGTGSARLEGKWITLEGAQDWSPYDYLKFEVFNPSEEPAQILLEIRDVQTREYWTRVNQDVVVPPGRSTATVRTDLYVGEKSRPGRALLRDQITHFFINPGPATVVIDDVRLERLDSTVAQFPGLIAYDFGLQDSPVMEGFTPMSPIPGYHPLRGHGWEAGGVFWRSYNVYQPDALFQDFVCPEKATFRVDVPANGRYHVWLNIDSPGGYWGEPQVYRKRTVTANGRVVVDETLDFDRFMQRHWRNAEREDLPGIDTFAQYVEPMFTPKRFDVDVTDGSIRLGFTGQSWANCLSALVIYPVDKAEQGAKFLDWVTARRRVQFEDYFKQVLPKRSGTPVPAGSTYVLFARSPMRAVNAYDGPEEGESLGDEQGLSLDVAGGEEAAITLALQPSASSDLGAIDVELSPFKTESGATLDAKTQVPGWIDYRITRIAMDGTSYGVRPRYWRPTPAPSAPGVTRRFWVRVKVPADAPPGVYNGQITLRPERGESRSVPVTIRVRPFALDPITDVAAGPWGSGIAPGWAGDDPAAQQWSAAMFERSLDALREIGCTSFSGRPSLRATAMNGKITLDTAAADREMASIRAKGFTHLISNYGAATHLPYTIYGTPAGPDEAAAKRGGFADTRSFLAALYGAIDAHAVEQDWLPVAWNLCDEPVNEAIAASARNALAHKQILPSLQRTTFMGATSLRGNDPKDPHVELVRALPIASMNEHDAASIGVVATAGNRFSFYNGGNRWTYGRYLKMLVERHGLALRLTWHFNIVAGDPYYALDCREDDYCWYNTDATGTTMMPSMHLLSEILPGLNDYRYFSTLKRRIDENPAHPAAAAARQLWDEMMNLQPDTDRAVEDPQRFDQDRRRVTEAIEAMEVGND